MDIPEVIREATRRYHLDIDFHTIVEHSVFMALKAQPPFDSEKFANYIGETARLAAAYALILKEVSNGVDGSPVGRNRETQQR